MKGLFKIHSDSDLITSLAPIPPPPPPLFVSQTPKSGRPSTTPLFYSDHDLAASLSKTTHTTTSMHRLHQTDDSNVLYLKQHKHSPAISPSPSLKSYASQTFSRQNFLQQPGPKSPIFVNNRLNSIDQLKRAMPTFVTSSHEESSQSDEGTTTFPVQHKEASSEPELVSKEQYNSLQKETYLAPTTANSASSSSEKYSSSLLHPVHPKKPFQQLPSLITNTGPRIESDSKTHLGLLEPISPMSPIILSSDPLFEKESSEVTSEPPAKIFGARPTSDNSSLEDYLLNIISTVDDTTHSSEWFPQSPNKNTSQDEDKNMNKPTPRLEYPQKQSSTLIQSSGKTTQDLIDTSKSTFKQSPNLTAGSRYLPDDLSDKSSERTSSILEHKSPNSSLSSYDRSSIGEYKTETDKSFQNTMMLSAYDYQRFQQSPLYEKKRKPFSFEYQTNGNPIMNTGNLKDTLQEPPIEYLNVSMLNQEGLRFEQDLESATLSEKNLKRSDSQPSLISNEIALNSWKDTLGYQKLTLDPNSSRNSQVSVVPTLPERSKARQLQNGAYFSSEMESRSQFTDSSQANNSGVQKTSREKPIRRETEQCILNKSLPLIPDRVSIASEPRGRPDNCKSNASSYYEWDTGFSTDDFCFDRWDKIDKDIQLLLNFGSKATEEERSSQMRRAQSEERNKVNGNVFHDFEVNTPGLKVPAIGRFEPNASTSSLDRPHQQGYFSQTISQERGYQKISTTGGAACYHSSLHNLAHLNERFSSSDSQLSADTIARGYQDDLGRTAKSKTHGPPLSNNGRAGPNNSKQQSNPPGTHPTGVHRTPSRSRSVPLLSLEAKMQQAAKEEYLKPVTVLENGSEPDRQHLSKLRNMHPVNGPGGWHKLMSVSSHGDQYKHSQDVDRHFYRKITPISSAPSKEQNPIAETAYVSRLDAWKRKLRKPSFNMLRNHT